MVYILLQEWISMCVYLISICTCLVLIILTIGIPTTHFLLLLLKMRGLFGLFMFSSLVLFSELFIFGFLVGVSFFVFIHDFLLFSFNLLLEHFCFFLLFPLTQVFCSSDFVRLLLLSFFLFLLKVARGFYFGIVKYSFRVLFIWGKLCHLSFCSLL